MLMQSRTYREYVLSESGRSSVCLSMESNDDV